MQSPQMCHLNIRPATLAGERVQKDVTELMQDCFRGAPSGAWDGSFPPRPVLASPAVLPHGSEAAALSWLRARLLMRCRWRRAKSRWLEGLLLARHVS